MIKNDRQLTVAERKAYELEEQAQNQDDGLDRAALLELLSDIRYEIEEYRDIVNGLVSKFQLEGLDDLADGLAKARLASGITQSELAHRLEVSEQMVQRDETGGYERASLARLVDVVDALDFRFEGVLRPISSDWVIWTEMSHEPVWWVDHSSGFQSDQSFPIIGLFQTEQNHPDEQQGVLSLTSHNLVETT